MQMWSGTSAFVAAVGDELPGLDSLADGDGPTADVAVDGGDVAGVLELDPLPEAADGAVGDDGAVADGVDRRADRRAKVDAGVQTAPAATEP